MFFLRRERSFLRALSFLSSFLHPPEKNRILEGRVSIGLELKVTKKTISRIDKAEGGREVGLIFRFVRFISAAQKWLKNN